MRQLAASAALLLSLTQGLAHGQPLAQSPAAQSPAPSASEQADATGQRIDRERESLRSTLLQEQQACRQGFWVNACLNEAQARYRQALRPLQQQQQALEQARRQQVSEQARQRVQDKQEAQEQRKAQADGASSGSAEPQSNEAARQAQARERALKQQQREAAAEQRRRDRAGAAPPEADAAETAPAVR